MSRFFVQTMHQRQLVTRCQFVRDLDMARMSEFLAAGSIDAPDMFTPQWNPESQEWYSVNFRDQ